MSEEEVFAPTALPEEEGKIEERLEAKEVGGRRAPIPVPEQRGREGRPGRLKKILLAMIPVIVLLIAGFLFMARPWIGAQQAPRERVLRFRVVPYGDISAVVVNVYDEGMSKITSVALTPPDFSYNLSLGSYSGTVFIELISVDPSVYVRFSEQSTGTIHEYGGTQYLEIDLNSTAVADVIIEAYQLAVLESHTDYEAKVSGEPPIIVGGQVIVRVGQGFLASSRLVVSANVTLISVSILSGSECIAYAARLTANMTVELPLIDARAGVELLIVVVMQFQAKATGVATLTLWIGPHSYSAGTITIHTS